MVPRATRSDTPLTATKPANSLVRSSVSRTTSPGADKDVPLVPVVVDLHGVLPRPHGYHCRARLTIRPRAGRPRAGCCVGLSRRPQKGGPPGGGGIRPGGRGGSTRGVEGGARASI